MKNIRIWNYSTINYYAATYRNSMEELFAKEGTYFRLILHFSNWRSLRIVLLMNYIRFVGFLAEILLPVAFMGLLIIIKSITDKYDSPSKFILVLHILNHLLQILSILLLCRCCLLLW